MSVSLTMIPIALALRVTMGKERFDDFIKSNQVLKKTTFKSERDLIGTIKKCGFDAQKMGGMIKTHFRDKKGFFFWELRDGVWCAVFSKYDSEHKVQQFMKDLEQQSMRNIFTENKDIPSLQTPLKPIFPTNFRNKSLLRQVLIDNGMNPVELENGKIICDLKNAKIQFHQSSKDSIFSVEVLEGADMQSIFKHLWIVDDEYKNNVQNLVYQNLLENVEKQGFAIEDEQVLEDNSIMITLNIQR
ncbi:hypothetical protein [Bacillus sp. PS06]|uniref:hypothetical protein n=1 Tax=Bacillus sp. PS06 TaxID=2764176 RepID=UPI00177B9F46|nr:hypothetical protein [Bacillus sp. PS06]MBD8067468.1 hypothetical protein [Bacillus sp. PS06]